MHTCSENVVECIQLLVMTTAVMVFVEQHHCTTHRNHHPQDSSISDGLEQGRPPHLDLKPLDDLCSRKRASRRHFSRLSTSLVPAGVATKITRFLSVWR